jgi:fatty-acid desaturase
MKLTPTKLFLFLMLLLVFLIVSIGVVGPRGMSANSDLVVGATMTYVFVVVPVVAIKMVSIAWGDVKEIVLRKGVNK